ncbi:ABC transporter substrate-binding protein [Rhizobium sp. RM]|uniref:ABC transporter substrate-binding protein n=1 Tax=Rhizobium sp. RM TaxID=2748079 RepID=UPI0015B68331|nr:ABC transporter substrate-binding protein [Rhizobium sp. RM]NWJ25729.1 ABC transporter substrate-binding protein [Rhizobium sp. RM]
MDLLITELLLTIGAVPVATSNIPLYQRLVANPSMPDSVSDLGPLNEPNLEYLQRLSPSRIFVADWQAAGLETATRIAPVTPIPVFAGKTPAIAHCEALIAKLADMTGHVFAARSAVAGMRSEIDETRARLKSFSRPVYVCRFNRDGRNLALFGGNGLLGDMLKQLGLRNAFSGRVNAAGVTNAPLIRLADEPDAVIIHFDRGQETDIALQRLEAGALWHVLPAVKNGRVIRMPVIYPNGGIRSAERFANQLGQKLGTITDG